MLAQWLGALDEAAVMPDGTIHLERAPTPGDPITLDITDDPHRGLAAFLDAASEEPSAPRRVKAQLTGPLTLGSALVRLGGEPAASFDRANELVGEAGSWLVSHIRSSLPSSSIVVFVDEPGLVGWRDPDPVIHRDEAVDRLSAALARIPATVGVHVCSGGDARIACEAGARIVGVDVADDVSEFALAMCRYLEGGGWVAWGAVPTHRPVGDSPEPLWRRLVEQWCELTRRGCDPLALRHRAILTPACGLAGHGLTQAERALRLAAEIGRRVGDQAAATRLTIGA